MFERYTESARRTIFFGRYEACQYGSPYIETEHLLLGILREDANRFKRWLPKLNSDEIRRKIDARHPQRTPVPTSVDLALSQESKRILNYAMEEADSLDEWQIGTEHMVLGILREEESFAAQLLQEQEATLPKLRALVAARTARASGFGKEPNVAAKPWRINIDGTVEIHGAAWKLDYVHDIVVRLQEYSWYWHKSAWRSRDIVVARIGGAISFDLSLAENAENFELLKAGWKKDHCAICRWELVENATDTAHDAGYTNGREWLCLECYEKFWGAPGFFAPTIYETT
jgi:hypothetical protein